jgi:hypothetical protein
MLIENDAGGNSGAGGEHTGGAVDRPESPSGPGIDRIDKAHAGREAETQQYAGWSDCGKRDDYAHQ